MGEGKGNSCQGGSTDKGREAWQRLLGIKLRSCLSDSRGDCTLPRPVPEGGSLGNTVAWPPLHLSPDL